MAMTQDAANRPEPAIVGPLYGFGAYIIWGLLPLYLKLLQGVSALQILSHRILWSLVLLAVLATMLGRWRGIGAALRVRRVPPMLLASALLIATNWLVYIWAVLNGHVLEASLGYFINPLVNVALGVGFLKERLRPWQAAAVAIAAAGVLWLALHNGGAIWISLTLAFSFGIYGLIRKLAPIDPLGGLLVETAVLAPACLGVVIWAAATGVAAFGPDVRLDLLLIVSGFVTAVPLLFFAAAAKRMRYSTLGLIQYLTPTLLFLEAVLLFGEPFGEVRLVAFLAIWLGCALYAADSWRASRIAPPVR